MKATDAHYRRIVETAREGIWTIDTEGRTTFANQRMAEILGTTLDTLLSEHSFSWVFEEDREAAAELFDFKKQGDKRVFEFRLRRQDGSPIWASVSGTPMYDDDHRLLGLLGMFTDITDRKRVEQKLVHFAAMVEHSNDAIIGVTVEGTCTVWNAAAERMFGYTAEEIVGKNVSIIVPEEHREEQQQLFRRTLTGDRVTSWETVRLTKSGKRIDIALNIAPIREATGIITGVVGSLHDITDRKQLEAERERLIAHIRSEHERVDRILESISDAFYAVDAQYRFTYVNRRLEEWWNRRREDLVGQYMWDVFPWAVGSHTHEMHIKAMTERQPIHYETRSPILHEWVGVSLHPDVTGGLSCYFQKITERKLAEEERRRQADELARSNADLQQFAYVTSHDLQEPLRTITSFSQMISRKYSGKLDEQADEYLHLIISGANRMKELIEALLHYSRAVNAEDRPFGPVALNEIVDVVLMNLQSTLEETHGSVKYDELPRVQGDSVQLIQLLQNLISNALKYRKPDVAPTVVVSADRRDRNWVISVKDNGIGVQPEFTDRIFGVFKRLHGKEVPGTGIGLAICKRIVQNHGGDIWVESNREGSIFSFTLPG